MNVTTLAAAAFAGLAVFPTAAQVALVLGAPWGSITMGGRWPEKLPPAARFGAAIQATILVCLAAIALDHAGVIGIGLPGAAIWVVAGVTCLSAVLNNITPSRIERRLWGPVTILMAALALFLAIT